jgi:hypothetical protein
LPQSEKNHKPFWEVCSNQEASICRHKAGGAAVGETSGWQFVAKNTLDIFHVQTSEAKSPPNLVSQGEGSGDFLLASHTFATVP